MWFDLYIVWIQTRSGASKLLDSMERYGLYRSLVADDNESRVISQEENIGMN